MQTNANKIKTSDCSTEMVRPERIRTGLVNAEGVCSYNLLTFRIHFVGMVRAALDGGPDRPQR
jgi:hypothetical protein